MSPSSLHTASINSLCWAPHELGLHLAAASSDGTISTLTYQADGSWLQNKVHLMIGDVPFSVLQRLTLHDSPCSRQDTTVTLHVCGDCHKYLFQDPIALTYLLTNSVNASVVLSCAGLVQHT